MVNEDHIANNVEKVRFASMVSKDQHAKNVEEA